MAVIPESTAQNRIVRWVVANTRSDSPGPGPAATGYGAFFDVNVE